MRVTSQITATFLSLGLITAPFWLEPAQGAAKQGSDSPLCASEPAAAATTLNYEVVPNWGDIPFKVRIGPTHGSVVVDKKGLVYTSTDSTSGFFVFNPDGSLLRTMAPEFSGVHGMMIRDENGEQFIYAAHLKGAQILKLSLDGKPLLTLPYPQECGLYPEGKGYKPTAVTVGPDGSIFAADGYGLSVIHKYDKTGKYLKTFGKKGKGDGEFQTCHGMALDTRFEKPLLLVCDRENRRLQHFDLDGNFVAVVATDLRRPAAVAVQGDYAAVAEIEGRVTILDKSHKVVANLGDNPEKGQWAKFDIPVEIWKPGTFISPHGLDFDASGNLYVQDWSKTGRLTKLAKQAK